MAVPLSMNDASVIFFRQDDKYLILHLLKTLNMSKSWQLDNSYYNLFSENWDIVYYFKIICRLDRKMKEKKLPS